MEHSAASNDLVYEQAVIAVQQATGRSIDDIMKMHRSKSSHISSSTPKSLKRKSKHSHEPRSISSTAVFAPSESPSNMDISRATAEMSRHHGIQSAPGAVPLMRGPSRNSFSATRSPTVPMWQGDAVDYSTNVSARRQPRHISGTMQDPSEFVASVPNFAIQSHPNYTTSSGPEPQAYDSELLYANSQYTWPPMPSPSFNSPRPSIDYTDASSVSPLDMSRDPTRSSFSSSFTDPSLTEHLAMMRVKSEASHLSCSDPQSRHSYQAPVGAAAPYPYSDHRFVPDSTAISSSTHYMSAQNTSLESSSNAFEFTASSHEGPSGLPYGLAPDMRRSSSNQSSASNSSSQSRSQRRHIETLQQSQRSLAPALTSHSSSASSKNLKKEHSQQALQSESMIRLTSENGESKVYGLLPRNTDRQKRPAQTKLLCPTCNDHPEGFRGEHELQRHVMRAHAKIRKVWICVDSSKDQSFLANCKACRTKKRYGAYYNAAAHLRRTHFNPRKRGRRSKGEEYEKRGGKGGGHWPPMNDLKENWMREIEEVVAEDEPDISDDAEGEPNDEVELEQGEDMPANYPNSAPYDPNTLAYNGQNFDDSPIGVFTPVSPNDMNVSATFDSMMNYYNGGLMSQATGMCAGDMTFDVSHHAYTQPAVAYNDYMGGQM